MNRAKPTVAVVLSGYGVVERGAETMLLQLLPRLQARFELHVYSRSGRGPGGVRRPAIPRTLVEPIYLRSRLVRKLLDTLFLEPLHVEWTSHLLASLPALVRHRYDVIWHETGLWGGRLLALVRRFTGVRLLDVAQSNALGWEVPFARCRPDLTVVHTEEFARALAQRVPAARIEIVPQGVDCDLFRPGVAPLTLSVPRPVVLTVGALSPEKAPELAVDAVAATGASLVMAGAGRLAAAVDRRAAERLGPGRYQRLTVPRSTMPALYAAADLLVNPSPRESGPLAVLEALACGLPVVGTGDAARRALVGDAGILVAHAEPALFGRAIEEALGRSWGGAPRRRAESFSLERMAARLGDLLDGLARGAP